MQRIAVFIDGLNLYHAIKHSAVKDSVWIDPLKLTENITKKYDTIVHIYYFSAFKEGQNKNIQNFNQHLKKIQKHPSNKISVITGIFKKRNRKCPSCGKHFEIFEEKETDVNIAIKMLESAMEDTFDTAILVSGDSDLKEALKTVKRKFPTKNLGVMIPIGRRSKVLVQTANFHMKMKPIHVETSQFPKA